MFLGRFASKSTSIAVSCHKGPYNTLCVLWIETILIDPSNTWIVFYGILPITTVNLINADCITSISNGIWIIV
jgi:hypothetical protein